MAGVSLKGIYKRYPGGVVAVSDFNLEIKDQEFIVLVGPSGCGKSTTLRMIAGLEEISDGDLYIGETKVNNIAPKDRDIAMVFQNYALYPHMTVFDNMAFGLKLRRVPKAEIKRRVGEAARVLDITHLLDRKPKALSGGQRQRVALGRAIVREPKVFLLDEPLSNLDAKLRTQMRTELIKLHLRLGTTFIYVTHDQTEAMTMGDRIIVMKDGFIQQVDTPQNLYDKPANMFVAGFIGSPQMNFVDGKLTEKSGAYYIELGEEGAAPAYTFKIPAEHCTDALKANAGKEVVVGIRSESISNDNDDLNKDGNCKVKVEIDVTELMGAETHLYFDLLGSKMISRVKPDGTVKAGDVIELAIDVEKVHIFDKENETCLTNI